MTLGDPSRRQIWSAVFLVLTGTLFGYLAASIVLNVWHKAWHVGPLFIAVYYLRLYTDYYPEWLITSLVILLPTLGGVFLSAQLSQLNLSSFGTTRWQTKADMRRGGFFSNPATGFLLGKTSSPEGRGRHIVSAKFPHCLLVAPTGAGKTVGFVIPNLLSYLGSAVVLDVKGECFEKTARYRESIGQKIYRFAPRDFDVPSHRFNPLQRIGRLKNSAQRMAEIDKLATLFLQAESPQAAGFLPNSKDVFIACAMLAFEQGRFSLGHVYRLVYGGELDNNAKFHHYARLVRDQSARLLFQKLGNTAKDTLSAYLSVLSSSGFAPWSNPHICAVTTENDFDFSSFRTKPQTVYFTASFDDLRTIAPLVRMFFSEVIASLQAKEPAEHEPFPVMILLDEFQRLGRMPILVDSLSLLRSYGVNIAIITHSIPDIDRIYGVADRKAMQANSGVKLYLTPSEGETISELSESCGTTTKIVKTKSRTIKDGMLATHISERSEAYPLLTKDDARRLPSDEIIIVINGEMPIKAKRLRYYADRALKPRYASQDMNVPIAMPKHIITVADYLDPDCSPPPERNDPCLEMMSKKSSALVSHGKPRSESSKPTVLAVTTTRSAKMAETNSVEQVISEVSDLFRLAQLNTQGKDDESA